MRSQMFGGFVLVYGDWAGPSRQVQKLNLGTALIPDSNPPIWDDSLQVRPVAHPSRSCCAHITCVLHFKVRTVTISI